MPALGPPRTSSLGSTAEFMVGGALSGWKTLHVLLAYPSQAHLGFPLRVPGTGELGTLLGACFMGMCAGAGLFWLTRKGGGASSVHRKADEAHGERGCPASWALLPLDLCFYGGLVEREVGTSFQN